MNRLYKQKYRINMKDQYFHDNKQYLHGLRLYEHPKLAVYKESVNELLTTDGFKTKEVEVKVIGENDYMYITKIFETDKFMTIPGEYIYGNLVYGIGFHKTRMIRFVETQLELFD